MSDWTMDDEFEHNYGGDWLPAKLVAVLDGDAVKYVFVVDHDDHQRVVVSSRKSCDIRVKQEDRLVNVYWDHAKSAPCYAGPFDSDGEALDAVKRVREWARNEYAEVQERYDANRRYDEHYIVGAEAVLDRLLERTVDYQSISGVTSDKFNAANHAHTVNAVAMMLVLTEKGIASEDEIESAMVKAVTIVDQEWARKRDGVTDDQQQE